MLPRCLLVYGFYALVVFKRIANAQSEKCAVLEFFQPTDDTIRVSENDYVNVTFWLNVSGCETLDTLYKMTVKVITDKNNIDDDGRLAITNGMCDITTGQLLRCLSAAGLVQLYKKVNRSHAEIEWKWRWKDKNSFLEKQKTIRLGVSYPPLVTNLTVDGQEVKGNHHFINEGQKVRIVCSFDNGNPPALFRLLVKHGVELAFTRDERQIISLLADIRCEQDWPVVHCEPQGSAENSSVSLLVRCPPQFTDVPKKFINAAIIDHVTLNIKAHTTAISGCHLTPVTLGENASREVNCSLYGNPPHLSLTVYLQHEENPFLGNWTLTVNNEIGAGETTLIFVNISASLQRDSVSSSLLMSLEETGAVASKILAVSPRQCICSQSFQVRQFLAENNITVTRKLRRHSGRILPAVYRGMAEKNGKVH